MSYISLWESQKVVPQGPFGQISTVQVQYKYSTSTVQVQYSTVQVQYKYSINTVQYPTGKNKKEGTDTLTLVNVFILYTHCHKYRIYFFIPSLGVNQIGSTNFSRVLAYSRTRVL